MSKIIVNNESGISNWAAMSLVTSVINDGFVSGEYQYCWCTTVPAYGVTIYARKTRGQTHSFVVRDTE